MRPLQTQWSDQSHPPTWITLEPSSGADPKVWGQVGSDPAVIERELKKLAGSGHVKVCYEAGPTGYGLARRLRGAGYACDVVAPSLVPTDTRRIKTDNRDGNLTAIAIPDAATEAIRDLVRARDAAKRAERVARHQLDKFLLRGNKTPLELFLVGIRGWDTGLRRRMEDGKPFSE